MKNKGKYYNKKNTTCDSQNAEFRDIKIGVNQEC